MAGKRKNAKITRYRRYSMLNIGTLLFGIIFIYMVICIFLYATAEHVTSYEVTAGSISGNYRYRALALKSEQIVTASQSGKVTYYAREGAKAGSGMTVCSINESNTPIAAAPVEIGEEDIATLQGMIKSFSLDFSESSYQNVYDFKADLESYVLQQTQPLDGSSVSLLNQCNAPASGFVLYATDDMETLTEEDLTPELFNINTYQKTNLRLHSSVRAGEPLYKLVTSEDWALYFPLDNALLTEIGDRSSIRFRFLKDNCTFSANFSIIQNPTGYFGKISLNSSLIRYVSDRFLEIELLLSRRSGLKIPTSAITEKTFYKIPEDYVIENSDTKNEITLLRETFGQDGSSMVRYVTANVYDKIDGFYLVGTELFDEGDYVQMLNTNKKFQIQASNVAAIQGVYNINKGYAIFREVTVIDENEEFCIVESNNPYGLDAHDHIVMDASTVDADEIVY